MAKGFIIAIDGTAGSGKSTTARLAAQELGFLHLDTGAMYRAVTLKVIRLKSDLNDMTALNAMLQDTQIDFLPGTLPAFASKTGGVPFRLKNRVILDRADVTEEIRSQEVDRRVSHVSAIPAVRQRLVAEQRRIAHGKQIVCEGRDVTSVVFPHADLKFYMDASLEARSERRRAELAVGTLPAFASKTGGVPFRLGVGDKSIMNNLTERDYIDSTRAHSPLTRVPDAILLDTTNLTIEEEVMIVVNLSRSRMAQGTTDKRSNGTEATGGHR
jgi:cytidylate kinase